MTSTAPCVLIVDDEAGFRELMTRILAPTGYRLRTATNAHEALKIIAEEAPAVAICDVHMPGPTGLWLAGQIRTISPHTAMVLATSDPTVPPTESMRRGVVAYILKPYQRQAVLNAVAEAFVWWSEASGGEIPRSAANDIVGAAAEFSDQPSASARGRHARAEHDAAHGHRPTRGSGLTRRLVLAVVVVAVLLAGFFYWKGHHSASDTIAHVATASGSVVVTDADGKPVTQGSGFFVAPDVFVTNRHVVAGGTTAKIVGADGITFRVAGVVAVDRTHDLVLLKTTESSAAQLALDTDVPSIGTPISVYGAPLGLRGTLSTGIVSTANSSDAHVMQITAPISHGSSGSPVVDADGGVVGVVVSSNMSGQGLNFAVPAGDVRALMQHVSPTMPLVVATRGSGDDRERYELIGPVRSATVSAAEPLVAIRQRIEDTLRTTLPAAEAQRRAEQQALLESKTRLIFDRQGHLVEKTLGDDKTIVQFGYDQAGHLAQETHLDGTTNVATLSFEADGKNGVQASDGSTGISHHVTYFEDGRVESEESRNADGSRDSIHWMYNEAGWPMRDSTRTSTPDEHDAMGNVVRRVLDGGDELRFAYHLDARGNWTSRDITRRTKSGAETSVGTERRDIAYWE